MINYEPLWTTVNNNNIKNKTELIEIAGISPTTLSKLSKNEPVSMHTIEKLCIALGCDVESIMSFTKPIFNNKKSTNKQIQLKTVSLFSGIGGFEEGIRNSKIDADIVFASEIDQFARKSYMANFDETNMHGDITKIKAEDIPNHELLLAGFPCQTFSIAGNRMGFEDKTRGTLFFDIIRILKRKKPKYILLENVKNLISHDKSKTIQIILESLNELGYTLDFTIINSNEAGVPQNRERTYIVGIYNYKPEIYNTDLRNKRINNLKSELNLFGFRSFNFFDTLTYNNKSLILSDILENVDNTIYYFENKDIDEFINSISIKPQPRTESKIIKLFDIPKEVHNDNERQRRVYSINGISPTLLARSDTTKILVMNNGKFKIRKLTPKENFKVQGFDDYFINNIKMSNVSNTQLYKQSGNAVSPPVITGIINHLSKYIEVEEN